LRAWRTNGYRANSLPQTFCKYGPARILDPKSLFDDVPDGCTCELSAAKNIFTGLILQLLNAGLSGLNRLGENAAQPILQMSNAAL
jgi:hypothetical protein